MDSMSWTRVAPPQPKGPLEHGGPKPDGYKWPPLSMQPGAFLVCDVCGGAVCPTATEKHDAWHAALSEGPGA